MRESQAGRDAISSLMTDPVPAVRCMAATHSLAWSPENAAIVLRELENMGGLLAVDAHYTLESFEEGRLNLDY